MIICTDLYLYLQNTLKKDKLLQFLKQRTKVHFCNVPRNLNLRKCANMFTSIGPLWAGYLGYRIKYWTAMGGVLRGYEPRIGPLCAGYYGVRTNDWTAMDGVLRV